MNKYLCLMLFLTITWIPKALAFSDGSGWAQVSYLVKILQESYNRYQQLQMMIRDAKDQAHFIRHINEGLENTRGLLRSLPIEDHRILAELRSFQASFDKVMSLYGQIPQSAEQELQALHDRTVAESLHMINRFKDYSKSQERNSQMMRNHSRLASPKGAARMTAESNAMILESLNQLIRLQSQSLKLQSQQLAAGNKLAKTRVGSYQKIRRDLGSGFRRLSRNKNLPSF